MTELSPGPLMDAVEKGAGRLEKASDDLYRAVKAAQQAEHAYEQQFEKELLTIYNDSQRKGERMPAEDVRRAIAHKNVDDKVYAQHLLAKAELAAQEKLFKGIEKAVSARQSVLRAFGAQG